MQHAPIGLFDSGVGGLSVLRAIRAELPHEDLIYVADSAYVPYGDKTHHFVVGRAFALTQFLVDQGAKAIVVACNTATAAAIGRLRAHFALPIVGVEPALKPAVAATRSGVVAVLATAGTLQSESFEHLVERYGQPVRVLAQACPGLAECVEACDLDGPHTRALVERYTAPLLAAGADTLVLGCTHYPFLMPVVAEVVGPGVTILETGAPVARQLQHVLAAGNLLAKRSTDGAVHFWTSGDSGAFSQVVAGLWGESTEVRQVPPEYMQVP